MGASMEQNPKQLQRGIMKDNAQKEKVQTHLQMHHFNIPSAWAPHKLGIHFT